MGSDGIRSLPPMLPGAAGGGLARLDARLEAARSSTRGVERGQQPQSAEVEKAATQFEALLLQQMLKSMWETVPTNGLLGGGQEEQYYRDILNEALADKLASQQSIGIKAVIAKDIYRLQKE